MKAHAELALDAGMPKENVFICHDGDAIVFDGDSAQIENDRASSAYLYVDGNVGGITNALLRDRREIGSDGLIVIVVTVDYQDGSIVGDVEVVTRGWIPRADVDDYKSVTQERVRSAVENALQAGEREIEALKAIVRKVLAIHN